MTAPYNPTVLDHFLNPRNVGKIENASGCASVGNPACGDIMEISVEIKDNVIQDAKFKTFGCAAAIATCSALTEIVIGKTIEEALKIEKQDIVNALGGLPPIKIHCSLLGITALKKAIQGYLAKGS